MWNLPVSQTPGQPSPANQVFRGVRYSQAEVNARLVLSDGYGEAVILSGTGGYYALYYLFGVLGLSLPQQSYLPNWIEGPHSQMHGFLNPHQMANWLDHHGYGHFSGTRQ